MPSTLIIAPSLRSAHSATIAIFGQHTPVRRGMGVPQPRTTGRLHGRARGLLLRAAGALSARDLCALSGRGHGILPACYGLGVGFRRGPTAEDWAAAT